MIILDRHILGTIGACWPFETQAPLVVDPDAVGVAPGSFQFLEVMPWKLGDVPQHGRGIQTVEPDFRLPAKRLELPNPLPPSETRRPSIAIAPDHENKAIAIYGFRQP